MGGKNESRENYTMIEKIISILMGIFLHTEPVVDYESDHELDAKDAIVEVDEPADSNPLDRITPDNHYIPPMASIPLATETGFTN